MKPLMCGALGKDLECMECGEMIYGKTIEDVCPYENKHMNNQENPKELDNKQLVNRIRALQNKWLEQLELETARFNKQFTSDTGTLKNREIIVRTIMDSQYLIEQLTRKEKYEN